MERYLRFLLLKSLNSIGISDSFIDIELPKDAKFGDLSTPIAMTISKRLKKTPREIAENLVDYIYKELGSQIKDIFEKIEIAGPGFINFTFSKKYLCSQLSKLNKEGFSYLTEDIGKGKRIQIEFVSANPTGPLHLGHGRGAAIGFALANLLKEAGYNIEKEYYINDAGRQVKLLGASVLARYKQLIGEDFVFPEDGYKGEYIERLAREFKENKEPEIINKRLKDEDLLSIITNFSYKKMLESIKKDLEDFGVFFDSWQSERELYQKKGGQKSEIEVSVDELKRRGYIYEKDGALWFKSTEFGDDKDRVIIKSDGEYTYFASDIAYHRKKIEKGFDELIDIWGADHHGYIPRIKAVIQALGYPKDSLKVLLVQMVTLLKGGKPVQMSKRSGEFITLKEVIDEIGPDTTKFLFLTRRPDSHLEIDIEVAKAQSAENPVYYVQYAYARINSIFEKVKDQEFEYLDRDLIDLDYELFNDEEVVIIKKLLLYPMMFKNAAIAHEPHRITFYLQELASMFHSYYHKYRVISEDKNITKTRLSLCRAIQIILSHGLGILGVIAPERM
jgi:arginyl-tRNA synthetase